MEPFRGCRIILILVGMYWILTSFTVLNYNHNDESEKHISDMVRIIKQQRNQLKDLKLPSYDLKLDSPPSNKPPQQSLSSSSSLSWTKSPLMTSHKSKSFGQIHELSDQQTSNAASVCFKKNDLTGVNQCPIDYLLIGFPKCGSSSMWRYLKQHPQVSKTLS